MVFALKNLCVEPSRSRALPTFPSRDERMPKRVCPFIGHVATHCHGSRGPGALCSDGVAVAESQNKSMDLPWNTGGSDATLQVVSSMGEGPFVATVTLGSCTETDTAFVSGGQNLRRRVAKQCQRLRVGFAFCFGMAGTGARRCRFMAMDRGWRGHQRLRPRLEPRKAPTHRGEGQRHRMLRHPIRGIECVAEFVLGCLWWTH